MSNFDLSSALTTYQTRCEQALQNYLSRLTAQSDVIIHCQLHQALAYASLNGGKRLRAALTYASGELFGASLDNLDAAASAVELIHCYSLVHDDMPEMDNDDFRRGKPSTHAKYDQATALLVGDNLQTLAFEILSAQPEPAKAEPTQHNSASKQLQMIQCLSRASGIHGMIGGQAIDMALEGQSLQKSSLNNNAPNNNVPNQAALMQQLKTLHQMKTGALITAAIELGAIAGNANASDINAMKTYGQHIGLLFQITDDILDETSNSEMLGKSIGKDKDLDKLTYTTLLGIDNAKIEADKHCNAAKQALQDLSQPAAFFIALADFIRSRKK